MLPDGNFQEQTFLSYHEECGCTSQPSSQGLISRHAIEKTEEMESKNKHGSMYLMFRNVMIRLGQGIGGQMDSSISTAP